MSKNSQEFQFIVERDGFRCYLCNGEFTPTNPYEIEHLDNNPKNNKIWNKGLAHHTCNNKKKTHAEYQAIAHDKIIQNKKYVYACERIEPLKEVNSSEQRNRTNRTIALQWVQEHLMLEPSLIVKDAVNAIANLCQNLNGTGSKQAVYRYFEEFTNPYNGILEIKQNEKGQNIILKRSEN